MSLKKLSTSMPFSSIQRVRWLGFGELIRGDRDNGAVADGRQTREGSLDGVGVELDHQIDVPGEAGVAVGDDRQATDDDEGNGDEVEGAGHELDSAKGHESTIPKEERCTRGVVVIKNEKGSSRVTLEEPKSRR
jgi:hypothetical protein